MIVIKNYSFLSSQAMGLTAVNPAFARVESSIVTYSDQFYFSSDHWILDGLDVLHNGQKKSISSDIDSLKPGESVAISVDSKGDLHFFYKGKHESVIWEGLPMKPLWGIVDVYGKVASVKVEILQREYYCYDTCDDVAPLPLLLVVEVLRVKN